jgi:hypothetical protein
MIPCDAIFVASLLSVCFKNIVKIDKFNRGEVGVLFPGIEIQQEAVYKPQININKRNFLLIFLYINY